MKKIFYCFPILFLTYFNSLYASSYELNWDRVKSDANKTIETTSIVLYVILWLLILFWWYLIYSNSDTKKWKIIIILSILSIFAIRLISEMLIVFNSSSI